MMSILGKTYVIYVLIWPPKKEKDWMMRSKLFWLQTFRKIAKFFSFWFAISCSNYFISFLPRLNFGFQFFVCTIESVFRLMQFVTILYWNFILFNDSNFNQTFFFDLYLYLKQMFPENRPTIFLHKFSSRFILVYLNFSLKKLSEVFNVF